MVSSLINNRAFEYQIFIILYLCTEFHGKMTNLGDNITLHRQELERHPHRRFLLVVAPINLVDSDEQGLEES